MASIGNFKIVNGWLTSTNIDPGASGYIGVKTPDTEFTLGRNVWPSIGAGHTCTMILENRIVNYAGVNFQHGLRNYNTGINMVVENSDINRFLSLRSFTGAKERTISIETTCFSNDADWYYRTCIRLSHMPSRAQISTLNSPTVRNVGWDEVSGYLFWY